MPTLLKVWCCLLLKGIEEKITETTIEALKLAKRMQEVTNEGFIVQTSIPKKLNNSSIEIHSASRPFPLNKFPDLQRAIGGFWNKMPTKCKFTKLSQQRKKGRVRLTINLYMRECLNPQSWTKVEVLKGNRPTVLTPELCDGAETIIMKGLQLNKSS